VRPAIRRHFTGNVSKTALLTIVLPLATALLFGTLIIAAVYFPGGYDWRVVVISDLTSPLDNPQGCWPPALGTVASMLMLWPIAGYMAQRLSALSPRLARSAGIAFVLSFGVMALGMVVQLAQPLIGQRWLHEFLSRAGAGSFIFGAGCCTAIAVRDRLRFFGGQRLLSAALGWFWMSLTLLPVLCLVGLGLLMLLGHQLGQTWAEDIRQSFRHTSLWHLAFWEWVGTVMGFAFLIGSALWLPASARRD
jgi:hypothetical protein